MSSISEETENLKGSITADDTISEVIDNGSSKVKLTDLKVVDLKTELDKRKLDKTGNKSALIERLKSALELEGKDPEDFQFDIYSDKITKAIKKEVMASETNGGIDELIVDTSEDLEERNANDVTLQLSIDEEEAILDISKTSDTEMELKSEEKAASTDDIAASTASTEETVSCKIESEELKDKKDSKSPIQSKGIDNSSASSPKAQKLTAKNEKPKGLSVLSKSLWITGLPNNIRAADLKVLFSRQGKVLSVKIVKSTKLHQGKCYGFITMGSSKDATKAIQNLHRTEVNGRPISVERTQSEPGALLKKSESKFTVPTLKKPVGKKEAPKPVEKEETKISNDMENKVSSKMDMKSPKADSKITPKADTKASTKDKKRETKTNTKSTDSKSESGKSDKEKSKDRDRKPRDKEKRDREKPARKTDTQTRNFNSVRPRENTFSRRPFGARSSLTSTSSNFRPRTTVHTSRVEREEFRLREEERRRAFEHRMIERKQQEEALRLEREKEKLRIERELLERERTEILKLEREKQRLERDRLEREREELRQIIELRSLKRPLVRDPEPFWDDRKRPATRIEPRSTFPEVAAAATTRYDYVQRDRPSFPARVDYDRPAERYTTVKALAPVARSSDYGDRDSRREVTVRSRDDRQVVERGGYKDRDISYKSRDVGYKERDTGFKGRDTSFKDRDTSFKDRDTGYKDRDTGFKDRDTGFKERDTGYKDRDIRRSFPQKERHSAAKREPARDNWKPERRVHERMVSSSNSGNQRRMNYY